MQLIESKTLGSAQASIEFTNIPQTFTDLYLCLSLRQTSNNGNPYTPITFAFNSSSANKSSRYLLGEGTGVLSYNYSEFYIWTPSSLATSNTFGNSEMYIPNYANGSAKSVSLTSVSENNSSANLNGIGALLWNNTAAITSITFTPSAGNFETGSIASLYGITKGSDGTTTVS